MILLTSRLYSGNFMGPKDSQDFPNPIPLIPNDNSTKQRSIIIRPEGFQRRRLLRRR